MLEPLGMRGRFGRGPLGGGRGGGNTEFRNIVVVTGPTLSCDKVREGAIVYNGLGVVVVLEAASFNCCTV
jgi:hypothetical protein